MGSILGGCIGHLFIYTTRVGICMMRGVRDVGVKREGVYILELHDNYHLRKKTLFSHSLYSFNRYVIPAVTP